MLRGAVARQERAHAARLHLGEHERGSIEGDQVDLAPARANVAREHREAQAFEVPGGDLLAKSAERAPWIGTAGEPAWRRVRVEGGQTEPRYRPPGRDSAADSAGAGRSTLLDGERVFPNIHPE
jgi:hypothetical protein